MIQKQIITKIRYILSPDVEAKMKFPRGWQKIGPGIYECTTEVDYDLREEKISEELIK